jgi:cytochrome c553
LAYFAPFLIILFNFIINQNSIINKIFKSKFHLNIFSEIDILSLIFKKLIQGISMKLKLALVSLSLVAVSFTGCGDEAKKEASTPEQAPVEKTVKAETPAPVETKAEAPAPKPAPAPVADTAPDGSKIFAKCAGCHGANAEKSALGKSQIIAGWEASKVADAIHGYKDGTYGGAMKGLMKGQVAPLSDAEIKAVAEFISSK